MCVIKHVLFPHIILGLDIGENLFICVKILIRFCADNVCKISITNTYEENAEFFPIHHDVFQID